MGGRFALDKKRGEGNRSPLAPEPREKPQKIPRKKRKKFFQGRLTTLSTGEGPHRGRGG